jgi:hypothetical protein
VTTSSDRSSARDCSSALVPAYLTGSIATQKPSFARAAPESPVELSTDLTATDTGSVWWQSRDASPVSDAENYADCKTHGLSHQEYWEHLVKLGAVPDGDY